MPFPPNAGTDNSILVVVPAFNAGRYLDATLDSVRRQSVSDWRCVIVDDGSTDGTADIARAWARADPRFTYRANATNLGVAHTRNAGFTALQDGPESFVIFLDNDDVWEPFALSSLRDRLVGSPELVAAYGASLAIDADGARFDLPHVEHWGSRTMALRDGRLQWSDGLLVVGFQQIVVRQPIMTPGLALVRKWVLKAVVAKDGHLFDQSVATCDDWDLWIRVSRFGNFGYVGTPVLGYRCHSNQASSAKGKMARATRRMRAAIVRSSGFTPEQRTYAHHAYAAWWAFLIGERLQLARHAFRHGRPGEAVKCLAMAALNVGDWLRLRVRRHRFGPAVDAAP